MYIFEIIGDSLHVTAIIFLINEIIQRKSYKGISGKTQILFFLVYATRYVDVVMYYTSFLDKFLKIVYICSSIFIISLIYGFCKNANENENDSFKAEFLVFMSFVTAVCFNNYFVWDEILWIFSMYLEAVAIIPQMYMIFNVCKMTYTAKGYLILMGPYKFFYILNWLYQYYMQGLIPATHNIISGIMQEWIYIIFLIWYCADKRFSKQSNTCEDALVNEKDNESYLKNNIKIFSLNLNPKSLDLSSKKYKYLPTVNA